MIKNKTWSKGKRHPSTRHLHRQGGTWVAEECGKPQVINEVRKNDEIRQPPLGEAARFLRKKCKNGPKLHFFNMLIHSVLEVPASALVLPLFDYGKTPHGASENSRRFFIETRRQYFAHVRVIYA